MEDNERESKEELNDFLQKPQKAAVIAISCADMSKRLSRVALRLEGHDGSSGCLRLSCSRLPSLAFCQSSRFEVRVRESLKDQRLGKSLASGMTAGTGELF